MSDQIRQIGSGLFFLIFGLVVVLLGFLIDAGDFAKNIMMGLGGYFSIVGLFVVLIKMMGVSSETVDLIFGLLGLWGFSVPSMLTLPIIYYHYYSQNLYSFNEGWLQLPSKQFWLGLIFSVLGLFFTLVGFLILRHKQGGHILFKNGFIQWGPGDPKHRR